MIKCIVWDLDNTIWNGILDEDKNVIVNEKALHIIKIAYDKGIINAVISKNNSSDANEMLEKKGLSKYFVLVEAGWGAKYISMKKIVRELNISNNHVVFIDDSEFELTQMLYYIPDIQVMNVNQIEELENILNHVKQYDNNGNRTEIYIKLMERKSMEKEMSRKDFLDMCNIELKFHKATSDYAERIAELSNRTNQFNSTGIRYSIEQINDYLNSEDVDVWIAEMKDIFCDYGIIAFSIIKNTKDFSMVDNMAISCRAEGKNIAISFLNFLFDKYKDVRVRYINTNKNGKIRILFAIGGLVPSENDDVLVLDNKEKNISKNTFIDVDEKIENEIKKIVEELLMCSINAEEEIELDSVILMNLIILLENRYNISIPFEYLDIESFGSVSAISKFVEGYLVN